MANIQTLQEKVLKATEKVEKCKGTIARHEKQLDKKITALAKNGVNLVGLDKDEIQNVREAHRGTDTWNEIYDVNSKMEDIRGANKKLVEAERILAGHQERLDIAIEKERFLDGNAPQVIRDFLEAWKAKAYEWYIRRYDSYKEFAIKLDKEAKDYEEELKKTDMSYKEKRKALAEKDLDYRSVQSRKASYAGATVMHMTTIYDKEERLEWLDKTLEEDKKAKMIDLINRINAVVGTITDASNLSVSNIGNLNGFIIGEKGMAKVETISAGGYAIQCFHYRTLVHEIK